VTGEAAVGVIQVDVVPCIPHLCPELEPHVFPQVGVLGHGEFHVPSAGVTDKTLDDKSQAGLCVNRRQMRYK